MGKSQVVTARDAASIAYAIAEACEASTKPDQRLSRVLTSVCDLIGARMASVCYGTLPHDAEPLKIHGHIEGGVWSEADRRMLAEYYARNDHEEDLVAKGIVDAIRAGDKRFGAGRAVLRQEVVSDRVWYGSGNVNDFRRASDLDACIYAGPPATNRAHFFGLTFHRSWGDRSFREKQRVIIDIVRHAVIPLLWSFDRSRMCADPLAILPPRRREVCRQLVAGHSVQGIARELGLTPSTVRTHIKHLYAQLGVHSRAELFAKVRS